MATKRTNRRHKARRIALFNHKGGVGKTLLTVNIAAELARLGKKTLIIDSDPQCNSTSYLVESSVVDELLENSDGESGRTIWSALRPIAEGTGDVEVVDPIEPGIRRLLLLPGDIRLSEFELELTPFWTDCLQRKPRGFRGTCAMSYLINQLCEKHEIDFVFYDSGPNIGPLNRIILLDCDFFIVPAACDEFSIRALKTLGRTLANWITDWRTILELAPEDAYLLPGRPKYLGYIPQRFRVWGGAITKDFSGYLHRLERQITADVAKVLQRIDDGLAPDSRSQTQLGQVPDFAGRAAAAQSEGVPIWKVGNTVQGTAAENTFSAIAKRIIAATSQK